MDPWNCNWATTRQVSPPSAQATVQRPAASEMEPWIHHGKPGILPWKIRISQGFHWISCGNPQENDHQNVFDHQKRRWTPGRSVKHKNYIGNGWSQEFQTVEICWFVILGLPSFPYHLWGYHISSHQFFAISPVYHPLYGPFMLHLNQF